MAKEILPLKSGIVRPIEDVKKEYIIRALCTLKWDQTRAAIELGVSRQTIINVIKEFRQQGYVVPAYDTWGNLKRIKIYGPI